MVSLTLVLLEWISAIEASTDLICNSLVVQHRRLQPDGAAEFILANSSLSTLFMPKILGKFFMIDVTHFRYSIL
jgi:hypothetical protein